MSADMDAPGANGSQAAQRRWARVRYENGHQQDFSIIWSDPACQSRCAYVLCFQPSAGHLLRAATTFIYCFHISNADICRHILVKSCWFAWHLKSPTTETTQALQTPDTQATLLESSCGMCMLCLKSVDDWVADNTTQRRQMAFCQERSCTAPQLTAITVACLSAHINRAVMLATPLK